jgi:ribosomal protein L16 Arg81 hydroxylase
MALTQESFRDPRRMYTVKVISGFYISRDKVANPGDILQFPRSRAHELVSSGQAVHYDPPPAAPALAAPAPVAPEAQAPAAASTQKSPKEK